MAEKTKTFRAKMTMADAVAVNPVKVAKVLEAHSIGGCARCGIARVETVKQVCVAYGIEVTVLLADLEAAVSQEA